MTPTDVKSYLPMFIQTATTSLDALTQNISDIQSPDSSVQENAVSESHRMAHSLKSSSKLMGFEHFSDLMLTLEKTLFKVKNKELGITPELMTALQSAVTKAHEDFQAMSHNAPEIDLSNTISSFKSFI